MTCATYECRKCGRTITRDEVRGVRIRHGCYDCDAMTTYNRVD